MQILVAEDNAVSSKIMKYLLEPLGNVEVVGDGGEAVELTEFCIDENTPFELICLDVHMPTMDGYETLRKIREIEERKGMTADEKALIVMISVDAASSEDEFGDMYQAYMTKPVSKQDLFKVLTDIGVTHPDAE